VLALPPVRAPPRLPRSAVEYQPTSVPPCSRRSVSAQQLPLASVARQAERTWPMQRRRPVSARLLLALERPSMVPTPEQPPAPARAQPFVQIDIPLRSTRA
jgi:hypothetical protein